MKRTVIIVSIVLAITVAVAGGFAVAWYVRSRPVPVVTPVAVPVVAQGKSCYAYDHKPEAGAPYAVHEILSLSVGKNVVAGTKTGTQAGPDMTNGYVGSISGDVQPDGSLDLVYSYTVEGSKNKEEELYRPTSAGLEKMRYPLLEKKGILVPDISKPFGVQSYYSITCSDL